MQCPVEMHRGKPLRGGVWDEFVDVCRAFAELVDEGAGVEER